MANEETIVSTLLSLGDLDGIGDVALLDLARSARVERLNKGERLCADEHLDRHVYVIEGEVQLVADGKTMDVVRAGSPRAKLSLFRVHTPGLYAKCTRKAALLSLDERTYKRHVAPVNHQSDAGIRVEELSPDEEEASLIKEVGTAFNHKEVDLPSLPEIAQRIFHGLDEQRQSIDEVVELLQTDPAIAARVIQVANSALYGNAGVVSVRDAIGRIGYRAIRTIVMSVVVRNLYSPRGTNIKKRMKQLYLHSIRVGAIAHALSRSLEEFQPDYAFLAGLIHDIGVIPLLIQADKREEFDANPELLETMLSQLSHDVGASLLEQWEFDPVLVTVSRESERWQRQVEHADYCDLIQVAQLHCALVGGKRLDAPALNELPAFQRLGMNAIDPMEVVRQARHEVNEVIALLAN